MTIELPEPESSDLSVLYKRIEKLKMDHYL